ncbi:hypothetical protein PEPTYR26121_01383 [Peptoniphilus tyrrelliae]|nr:hypothetical protein PEPTYR26121_01383 [Peptoniphilus tyrrelliae]
MNYIDIIRSKIKKNNGIITNKELVQENIPTVYLHRMMKSGELNRVDRGVYLSASGDYDEYYFLDNRFSVPIFSFSSALYLHNMADIIPNYMDVTVYNGYNVEDLKNRANVHYVNKKIYKLGICKIKTRFGNVVSAYNKERTFCDVVKNRKNIDNELFAKTINGYMQSNKKNMRKLYSYAKEMKIENQVREIVEVFGK